MSRQWYSGDRAQARPREAVVSMVAGLIAGMALVGFGIDSVIEVTASAVAQWRLRSDVHVMRRERVERLSQRLIEASFPAWPPRDLRKRDGSVCQNVRRRGDT